MPVTSPLPLVFVSLSAFFIALISLALGFSLSPAPAGAAALPSGFREEVAIGGLRMPTAVEFSGDGRVFVAEKSGLIKVFDGLSDATPTTFADLRTEVHNYWDRGLLGLALDPGFPNEPYVYALYTHDAAIGGTAPRWGAPDATSDSCPTPPGGNADGCVVSGRLLRLQANLDTNTAARPGKILIEDWCAQYPSHTVGDLAFGNDGALYVSGGDGASFQFQDYGQDGEPPNPCGDPPVGVGGMQAPPTAEGGSLRSQDLRTSGDPVGLDGSILRVDPDTGAALPDNPLYSSGDPNARRIVAHGTRNPFRMTVRPGTGEVWAGDVGQSRWEEIDRVTDPTGSVKNFGWPCYEGGPRHTAWDSLNMNICENLYGEPNAVTQPFFAYHHQEQVVAGETCQVGSSAITGLAFYEGGSYPDRYDGSLFFADSPRRCIWVMFKGPDGLPDPATRETFVADTTTTVDLQIGPDGDLFYVNLNGGEIRRVRYFDANRPPTAVAKATPTNGPVPLEVAFDGTGSSDPDPGDALSYAWDLDGDGEYDDSASPNPSRTYADPGSYTARLEVTDGQGASDTDSVVVRANDSPPTASIDVPLSTTTWRVDDTLDFSGSATDEQDGALPASALSWELIMHHCPSNCHEHPLQQFQGVAGGDFVAPDHEYPSHLELRLTATDSSGLTDTESVRLDPKTVRLDFRSDPEGLELVAGDRSATPFSRTVIVGSKNTISAPSPQTLGGTAYEFESWSDGGARSHDVTAGAEPSTYVAAYSAASEPPDTTRPTITLTTPPDGATYAQGRAVSADYECQDEAGGSGMSSCEGPVADGSPIDTGTPGTKVFTVRAVDGAGNTSSVTHTYAVSGGCTVTGTAAGETLTGTTGDDVICGGGGNDTIKGLGGDDVLKGEDGNDKLFGGPNNDGLDGGPGADVANFSSSSAAIIASLSANDATGEGDDTMAAIEYLTGSKYGDDLGGSGGANTILGGSGTDTLSGFDGADKLQGDGGSDTLRGGLGNDSVSGNSGSDRLYGEDDNDSVNSRDGVNGNDSLDGGPGTDTKTTDTREASIVGFP